MRDQVSKKMNSKERKNIGDCLKNETLSKNQKTIKVIETFLNSDTK